MGTEQLTFDFPSSVSYHASTFVVTPSNQIAYSWVHNTEQWNNYGLLITGASGSGKTHLAHLWQEKTDASFIDLHCQTAEERQTILDYYDHLILEDIEAYAKRQEDLFHLLNQVKERKKKILLTAQGHLRYNLLSLKDLLSRLKALLTIEILQPDDMLFQAIMRKRFADLQVQVDDRIIHYLLLRSERSFHNLHFLVSRVYQISLSMHHKPTYALIRDLV